MATKIQLRRDTGANWDANSTVVLAAGEIGVNLTNGQFKLGDGTSTWAALSYYAAGGAANTGNFAFSGNTAYNSSSPDTGLYIAPGGESTSYLFVPGNSESTSPVQLTNTSTGGVQIQASNHGWLFGADGTFQQNNSFTKTGWTNITTTAPTVVWTASHDYISGVKLMIQVEANENGDATGWHSQVCEAIVASRGYANSFGGPGGTPVMTVYGVTYTSTLPLVTFTVQRNPTTKFIEVVGTLTAAVNPASADLRIYSVETATND